MVAHSTRSAHLPRVVRSRSAAPLEAASATIAAPELRATHEAKTELIDRSSRDVLIELLTAFAAGRITREELFARKPKSRDRAVGEILAQASLLEVPEEASPRTRNLTGEDRSEVVRWMLFLETDCEYRWPSLPAWLRVAAVIPSILTFGLIWRPYRRWFESRGDHRVWPFLEAAEHREARGQRRNARSRSAD